MPGRPRPDGIHAVLYDLPVNRAFSGHKGYASALAWILFAIIMVLTLLVLRSSDLWVFYEGERKR
jgi:ABC-type sugar transport system permease subunit